MSYIFCIPDKYVPVEYTDIYQTALQNVLTEFCECIFKSANIYLAVVRNETVTLHCWLCLHHHSGWRHYVSGLFVHLSVRAYHNILSICWWNLTKLSLLTDLGQGWTYHIFGSKSQGLRSRWFQVCWQGH